MCSERISDADVEGTALQMREIANAIKRRGDYSAKRCAVQIDGDQAYFCSPRNSRVVVSLPFKYADALADQITREIS